MNLLKQLKNIFRSSHSKPKVKSPSNPVYLNGDGLPNPFLESPRSFEHARIKSEIRKQQQNGQEVDKRLLDEARRLEQEAYWDYLVKPIEHLPTLR